MVAALGAAGFLAAGLRLGAAAGVSFADADLLGVPLRIVVGKGMVKDGTVEIAARDKSFKDNIPASEVLSVIDSYIDRLWEGLR